MPKIDVQTALVIAADVAQPASVDHLLPSPGTRVRLRDSVPYAKFLRDGAIGEVLATARPPHAFTHSTHGMLLCVRFAAADLLPAGGFYQGNQTLNFADELEVVSDDSE